MSPFSRQENHRNKIICEKKNPAYEKIIRLWILIAQKKRPDALNAKQNTLALFNVLVHKKSRQNTKKKIFL